jgi:hypothetical protein
MKKQEVRIVVGKGLDCSSSPDKHHHWINDYTRMNDVQLKVIRCKFCRRILRFTHFSDGASKEKELPAWMKKRGK